MHIVITGGAGFLGSTLARAILAADGFGPGGRPERPVARLTVLDQVQAPDDLTADPRVHAVVGDLRALLAPPDGARLLAGADVIYHLAAAVSGECEADFDLGMSANIAGGQALLEAARALPDAPVLVFTSSLAVYGGWPGQPLPAVVTDTTLPTPRTSYGIQKFVIEQLVADYTRKGYVDGRTLRLVTVSVRPGRPNRAASSFLSGIIREPLRGERAACPVPPETTAALASPSRTIAALLLAGQAPAERWGPPTGLNLPALEVSVARMVDALRTVAGPAVAELIDWRPDPVIAEIVTGWPSRVEAGRATALGLSPDPDYESVIRAHLAATATR